MVWFSVGLLWIGVVAWRFWRERRSTDVNYAADLLAGGLLWGLVIGFFWRTLSGDVYQPADGGDLVSFLFPTYRFAAAQLREGILPLWNPTLYAGAPFIGDIQAGFLYIPNLILFYLWPDFDYTVMQWLVVGHLYWAGLGMYVFLRIWLRAPEKQLSRPAAFFGAVAFAFCDPFLLHIGNLNLIAVLSWLPWILAAYQQALYWHSLRWAAIAGFLFAFANFAGHAQSTFYIGLIVSLYTLGYWLYKLNSWRTVLPAPRISLPRVIAVIQYPLVTATLTVLLTAPILLPAMELARVTERSNFTYQDTVAFSLAPTQAIGLLTPSFFGRGPALHWSLWSRVETPYVGIITLLLAVTAVLLSTPSERARLWVWVGMAAVGFTTALGIYAIIHGWLAFALPFFDQFRAPARALVLWAFALAIMAANGFDALLRSTLITSKEDLAELEQNDLLPNGSVQRLQVADDGWQTLQQILRWGGLGLVGIIVPLSYLALLLTQENEVAFLRASLAALALTLAALFWLSSWVLIALRRRQWLSPLTTGLLLIGLLFFDLSATGAYTDISPENPTVGYNHPELVEFLRNEPTRGRIDSLTDIAGLWQPDSAALLGLEDVGGIANPLMLDLWHQLWESLGGRQSKLYDMLHVTHVIVRDGTPLPEGKFTLAFDAPGELAVFRNQEALPRAWLVHRVATVDTTAAALAALHAPDFDPARQAVVQASTIPASALGDATGNDHVQVTRRDANALSLTVSASSPGLLVLSELWYPGWRATVDGMSTTLLRTNSALRGLLVPGGESVVELWFAPDSWRAGLISAIAGWILTIIIFIFEKGRR
ncbi:MAG: hypothetical protein R2932_14540 [Caldilineaceae bacterium]